MNYRRTTRDIFTRRAAPIFVGTLPTPARPACTGGARRSISTQPYRTTGCGTERPGTSQSMSITSRPKLSPSSSGTVSSGAAAGCISTRCTLNTDPSFWATMPRRKGLARISEWALSRSARHAIRSPPMAAVPRPIRVNRAPVLTLWATVVAERLGYPPETALTLGRFVAGSSARAKARRLGISDEKQDAEERHARAGELKPRRQTVRLPGRDIPVLAADDGTLRAKDDGKPASAKRVQSTSLARSGIDWAKPGL